ncbi:PREDICTED: APOBEC1 complementation factor-like [Nicrophorus vespilloides]|uniref:APOBEC1 complementation factor-like n=1 Tax=Nicrophorus vespilloides TaxID=110193 RepID=A0ABM1MA40_NICVS|nr:PREDICTED: APOBEC1 complementation factor-like [Nicrophorus vespilloides]
MMTMEGVRYSGEASMDSIEEETTEQMMRMRLLALVKRTGYRMIQTNGQRVYSAPDADAPPKKGCEVFVGKLPRNMFEDEIVEIFEQIGPIYQLRLMMDFSGMNRGFAFVSYYSQEFANLAVDNLHDATVRSGKRIGVYKSIDNCRLFIGGIPKNIGKEEVYQGLSVYVEGIKEVIMYFSRLERGQNRGFVFVEFEEHRLAAMARRKLAPGSVIMWGVPILVDWADPLPDVNPSIMAKVKTYIFFFSFITKILTCFSPIVINFHESTMIYIRIYYSISLSLLFGNFNLFQISKLYLRNLDLESPNEALQAFLSLHVDMRKVIKLHKIMDFAFVHFVNRESAEEALYTLHGLYWKDSLIEVTWARPKFCSKVSRLTTPPDHFCTSLPPRIRKQVIKMKQEKIKKSDPQRSFGMWSQSDESPLSPQSSTDSAGSSSRCLLHVGMRPQDSFYSGFNSGYNIQQPTKMMMSDAFGRDLRTPILR